ncbi:unnamed protein product, partial [Effrenium voratum]
DSILAKRHPLHAGVARRAGAAQEDNSGQDRRDLEEAADQRMRAEFVEEDLLLALQFALAQQETAQAQVATAQEQEAMAVRRLARAEESGDAKKVQSAERKVERAKKEVQEAKKEVQEAKKEVQEAKKEVERAKKEVKEAKASGRTKESEGTSRLQRYLAPKYDLREKHIDGQKLLVCDFKDSTRFAIVSSELMQRLTAWVEDRVSSQRGICAINGMVKLGKTTVLTHLLPQIILTKFPNAEICFLDFSSFLNAGFEPGAMEEGLLKRVAAWATSAGFHVGPGDMLHLDELMDNLDRSGRTVFFLIDEVQRFFQVQEGIIPTWDILKGFLRVNREDSNLHFAITGSDMALAWQHFVRMTPNGFTFAGACRRVSLPWQNPVHELDYARQKFLATAVDDTEKDELTDLLGEIRSVPLMAYTAAVWKDEQSKIDTQKRVNMKLRDEFVTEMTPLLGDPSWSNPQRLQYIRDLAIGQATSDPADFFDETVYDCFFKPYIYEADGKFSFASNPWTVCVAYCLDASGTLLNQSNFPVLQWCQNEQRLQQLARVGELVKGTLRRWFPSANSPLSGDQKKLRWRVESICRRHGRQHGWHPEEGEPYFQQLLNWSNSGVNVSIRERQLNRTKQNKPCRLDMRWCTYLEMLRNANAHFTSRNRADYEELLFNCLPSQTGLLLAALRNFTLSRPR